MKGWQHLREPLNGNEAKEEFDQAIADCLNA